jgi:hypothetical protein
MRENMKQITCVFYGVGFKNADRFTLPFYSHGFMGMLNQIQLVVSLKKNVSVHESEVKFQAKSQEVMESMDK